MRRMDEERATRRTRRTSGTARRTVGSSERPNLPEDQARDSDSNSSQATLNSASITPNDTFSRLQQIRTTLSYLEATMLRADRTRDQSNRQDSTSPRTVPDIRPPHSAIVLSEEGNSAPHESESLRDTLDEIGADLPEYMHATANMIQNMTRSRSRGTVRQTVNIMGSSRDSTSTSRLPIDPPPLSPDIRDDVNRWYVRPSRETDASRERNSGRLRPETPQSNNHTHTLPAWRAFYRNDDSATTLLGRRVASRAAAAAATRSSANSLPEPRSRVVPLPSLLHAPHSAIIPRNASRVVIPPRIPDRVSRRIAQFESAANEGRRPDDSDGSETEVNNNYIFRPVVVRRRLDDSLAERRRRRDSGSSPVLPDIVPVSPLSSPGGIYSTGPSSAASSPRDEARRAIVSSRMQNITGHLNRISDVLSDGPNSTGPVFSSTDVENLDGALFSRQPDEGREGDNLYHEVIDEEEGRTYRIRRRLNADGDEHVHQINSSDTWWDDDSYTNPFFPSSSTAASRETRSPTSHDDDQRIFSLVTAATNDDNGNVSLLDRLRRQSRVWNQSSQSQRSETDLPPLVRSGISVRPSAPWNMPGHRRRGWVRLDPNGDEIPTDEEEEIERLRMEQRIQNSHSAWRTAASPSTVRTRLEYLAPTTRSVFSHATDDSEDDENEVRVRLNLPPGQSARLIWDSRVFSDSRKEKEKELESEYVFFGTTEPYYTYPLPMPVEDMISSRRRSSRGDDTWRAPKGLREKEFAGC